MWALHAYAAQAHAQATNLYFLEMCVRLDKAANMHRTVAATARSEPNLLVFAQKRR